MASTSCSRSRGGRDVAKPLRIRYTVVPPRRSHRIDTPPTTLPPLELKLGVWRLALAAAPNPLVFRRDRPFDEGVIAAGVPDVVRYVATARQTLRGPLVLEIEGPGDPLASPETVLRSLALVHAHYPDVMTGLVIDGPLLGEYAAEMTDFGLRYVVLRMDAATVPTARRLVDGAIYRGERLDRAAATDLVLESGPQALQIARRHRLPTVVRFTLVPTVNAGEVGEVAQRARDAGALRMHVVPHVPAPDGPLAKAGVPSVEELADARGLVTEVFDTLPSKEPDDPTLDWLVPERLQPVDTDELDVVDVMRGLPSPTRFLSLAPVLPPRRSQLVAVATRDGTLVDTPLGVASMLRIYVVTEQAIRLIGSRPLSLDPRRRQDGVGNAQAFLQAIVGCRAVVASQIPSRAMTLLEAVGVKPVALGGTVEEVLDRVARGTVHPSGTE